MCISSVCDTVFITPCNVLYAPPRAQRTTAHHGYQSFCVNTNVDSYKIKSIRTKKEQIVPYIYISQIDFVGTE